MFESKKFSVQQLIMTPDLAKSLLGQNTHNRRISAKNFNVVKAALERGEWKLNGEAIKVAIDGRILDGQHRLMACAETGIPFETLLITGLANETQETMDTGKSRTLADVLTLRGYPSGSTVAATLAGIIRSERYGGLRSAVQVNSQYPVTNAEAVARLEAEPHILDIATSTKRLGRIGLPGRIASTAYYAFSKIEPDDAQYFFDKLWSGESLERGNAILTLRNTLIASQSHKGERSPVFIMAITIKAWNKFRAGEQAAILRFVSGGATPEPFPEPK